MRCPPPVFELSEGKFLKNGLFGSKNGSKIVIFDKTCVFHAKLKGNRSILSIQQIMKGVYIIHFDHPPPPRAAQKKCFSQNYFDAIP